MTGVKNEAKPPRELSLLVTNVVKNLYATDEHYFQVECHEITNLGDKIGFHVQL